MKGIINLMATEKNQDGQEDPSVAPAVQKDSRPDNRCDRSRHQCHCQYRNKLNISILNAPFFQYKENRQGREPLPITDTDWLKCCLDPEADEQGARRFHESVLETGVVQPALGMVHDEH